jgi:hypothetical protein
MLNSRARITAAGIGVSEIVPASIGRQAPVKAAEGRQRCVRRWFTTTPLTGLPVPRFERESRPTSPPADPGARSFRPRNASFARFAILDGHTAMVGMRPITTCAVLFCGAKTGKTLESRS